MSDIFEPGDESRTIYFPERETKLLAEPLLWNLHRLVDEYGYRGVLSALQDRFGPTP